MRHEFKNPKGTGARLTAWAPTGPDCHSAREVCALTGVSYRQLDYWCRRGYAAASIGDGWGSGSARRFNDADLARVRELVAARRLLWHKAPEPVPEEDLPIVALLEDCEEGL